MPGNVLDLMDALRCTSVQLCVGTTSSVAMSGGRFLSQRMVFLVNGWPNICGWIVWLGAGRAAAFSGVGFSMQSLGTPLRQKAMKNALASVRRRYLSSSTSPSWNSEVAPALLR